MSMDNTVKVRSKATVIDKDKTHIVLMKGGVLSILNENNEINHGISGRCANGNAV